MFRGGVFRHRQRQGEFGEAPAAGLEVGELVEARAGRREQHHGRGQAGSGGVSLGHRALERAHDAVGDAGAGEGGGQHRRVAADQQGLGNAREQGCEALDAAGFRLAAGDPDAALHGGERARGGVRVGGLAVVDEADAVHRRHQLLAVGKAGEARERRLKAGRGHTETERHHRGRGGVLVVVRAGQGGSRAQVGDTAIVDREHAVGDPGAGGSVEAGHRDGAGDRGRQRGAVGVVDADHGEVRGGVLVVEDAALGVDIARHVAVAVEMVGREVEQHRGVEAQMRHALEHVARHLEHVDAVVAQQRQGQCRRAEIATRAGLDAGPGEQVADQHGGGGFAVGAGDAHEAGLGAGRAHGMEQDRRIRQHGHPTRDRRGGERMRAGAEMRDAGGEHQRVEPLGVVLLREPDTGGGGLSAAGLAVVPRRHVGAHRDQPLGRRQTVAAETEHRDAAAGEQVARKIGGEVGRVAHRIFSVARPIRPRITETIQNRITMVGSAQPFFSK